MRKAAMKKKVSWETPNALHPKTSRSLKAIFLGDIPLYSSGKESFSNCHQLPFHAHNVASLVAFSCPKHLYWSSLLPGSCQKIGAKKIYN